MPEVTTALLNGTISGVSVLDLQDHMHLIPVPVEALQLGMHVFMELQYGAADQVQQGARSQPGRMHVGTQCTDDQNDRSKTQQANGGPKGHASLEDAQIVYRPGYLVKPSQAVRDFVFEANLRDHAEIVDLRA